LRSTKRPWQKRSRAQTLANETREKTLAEGEAERKALDATLNAKIATAEKAIAERQAAAMLNVQGIAAEAATAIVERLVGVVPARSDVNSAVAEVLKR